LPKSLSEFPPESHAADYEKRIKAAYPIHPEIFHWLYTDWSTLVKFQRTRGVLRLMAAVSGEQNCCKQKLWKSDITLARSPFSGIEKHR
jgi:hypothetical protein